MGGEEKKMKAVLVIDMPESCINCPCMYETEFDGNEQHYGCYAKEYKEVSDDGDIRPSWCPLKPLPQKKETDGHEPFEIFMHREGWNQCLDEITGETDPMERYL